MPTDRPSVPAEIKIAEAKAGLYSRIIFGWFCILSGIGAAIFGVWTEHLVPCSVSEDAFWKLSHILMVGGMIWAIFGGLTLPSVFDAAKPVFSYVFPNGLPIIGGRRASDPKPPGDSNGST